MGWRKRTSTLLTVKLTDWLKLCKTLQGSLKTPYTHTRFQFLLSKRHWQIHYFWNNNKKTFLAIHHLPLKPTNHHGFFLLFGPLAPDCTRVKLAAILQLSQYCTFDGDSISTVITEPGQPVTSSSLGPWVRSTAVKVRVNRWNKNTKYTKGFVFIYLGNTLKHVDCHKENTRTGKNSEIPLALIRYPLSCLLLCA